MRIALVLLVGCAGVRYRNPPAAPAPIVPPVAVPDEPPPPGAARVVFDVVDGPSLIELETRGMWTPLCTTPCAAELPAGTHHVSFQLKDDPRRADADLLTVPAGSTAYRRALGDRSSNQVLLYGGGGIVSVGISVILMSLLAGLVHDKGAATTFGLAGFGMVIGGGGMFLAGLPSKQPGSATQFSILP